MIDSEGAFTLPARSIRRADAGQEHPTRGCRLTPARGWEEASIMARHMTENLKDILEGGGQAGAQHHPGLMAATERDLHRLAIAREALALAGRALNPEAYLELTLAGDPRPEAAPAAQIVVNGPDVLASLLRPPSPDAFGEAYLRGDIDIEGDIWVAVDGGRSFTLRVLARDAARLMRLGLELRRGAARAPALHRRARLTGRRHSRARDLAAVRFHYDVGNDFYALWLDRRLTYSCAYFETAEASLDDAQEAKLDLICRKLRLGPGMRLLDIGCGWGSLVVFAAERYGVEATGITLSAKQAERASDEIRRRDLEGRSLVTVRDYRDLARFATFDAVASVGIRARRPRTSRGVLPGRLPGAPAGRSVPQSRDRDDSPRRHATTELDALRRWRLRRSLRVSRRRARDGRGCHRLRPARRLRAARRPAAAPALRSHAPGVGRASGGVGRAGA